MASSESVSTKSSISRPITSQHVPLSTLRSPHERQQKEPHNNIIKNERPPIANQQPYAVIHTDRLQLPHLIADTGADRPPLSGRVLAELHELLDNVGERLCSVNLVGAASPQ